MRGQTASSRTLAPHAFRRDIQGLRAVAVALVVVFHTGYALPGGFVGVDVFFVVSGFLIIGLLDREAQRSGRLDLAAFFARRARRLLPVLAFVTTATLFASAALVELGAPLRAVARTAAGASVFAANAVLYRQADYFAPEAELNPLLHTWSLSVEEQFYFFVPIALAAALALHRSGILSTISRRLAWALFIGLGSAASFALSVLLVDIGGEVPGLSEPVSFAFYAPLTRAWQFGAGGLLALGFAADRIPRRLAGAHLLPLGLVLIGAAALAFDQASAFPGFRAALPTVGTLLALAPGAVPAEKPVGVIMRVLSSAPMVLTGGLSYSWYLWHWPLIVLARLAFGEGSVVTWGAVGASFALAMGSKKWVEDGFRFDRRFSGARAIGLAAACIAVPLFAALVVGAANDRVSDRIGLGLDDYSWSRDDCHVKQDAPDVWESDRCTRGRASPEAFSVDVLLIGDSHADALADGVLSAVDQLGLSLGVRTVSSQPPLGQTEWVERHKALIELVDPQVVVLAARSTFYAGGSPEGWLESSSLDRTRSAQLAIDDLWIEELRKAVDSYRALGPRIIWVQNVPEFPRRTATLLSPIRFEQMSVLELAAQRESVVERERQALLGVDGVFVLDPAEVLCDPECRNGADGQAFYYDSNHLSPTGSRLLTAALQQTLRAALPG
jgi:peptidoglycan/LPS O-acetylase OafA/YrhL